MDGTDTKCNNINDNNYNNSYNDTNYNYLTETDETDDTYVKNKEINEITLMIMTIILEMALLMKAAQERQNRKVY